MQHTVQHSVVCFGEVLWDILPNITVPGGAPMNVAYHLHKLGKAPALITRIGSDEHGDELLKIFSEHGVETRFFQIDDKQPTGKVFAKPNSNHEMVYDIVRPVAWDFITWKDEYADLVTGADYFVFGSLAARNDVSRETLLQLIESARNRVLDINLRSPHYNKAGLEELLHHTNMLKLNQAELELMAMWFTGSFRAGESVQAIMEKFSIETVVVTMGEDGAALYMNEQFFRHKGFKVQVADTVGSGDAFLAGLLSKLMDGAAPAAALEFACAMGAFIASQTGACPHYEVTQVENLIFDSTSELVKN